MLGYIEIVLISLKKNLIFSMKARRPCKEKIGGGKTPCSVNLSRSWLHAIRANFGFLQFFEKSTCGDLVSHKYSFL